MASVSEENKIIAKTLVRAFGGKPSIRAYWDEREAFSVDILKCEDAPEVGVNSYGTVNLSDTPLFKEGIEYPVRAEILGVCQSDISEFPNLLSTCAFNIKKNRWFAAPSVVFPDVISMYEISTTMRHVAFFQPFIWENDLPTLELKSKTVDWLLAVPISDAEYRFALKQGFDELEEHFEAVQIDIFDVNRPSSL